jgi:coenzyme F420-0:L-glutamate ligase/coenzyme F420-1:gamma-L-glutamate ligase
MTNLLEAIKNRRSIRKYTQQPVPLDVVSEIIQTATYAPSAHNAQPWRFILLTEESEKRAFAQAMARAWLHDLKKDGASPENRASMARASEERFASPPVLIVVCLTIQKMMQFPDQKRQQCEHDLAVQSLGAVIQNLLLAAHDKKLGSCWYCSPIFCKKDVRQALGIPENVEPQALITLGYPNETVAAPQRDELCEVAYKQKWGNPI